MRNGSVSVQTGDRFGRIVVGELVRNVQEHPLFIETRISYLRHGRLRECKCDCGTLILYSENVLSSGQIKSCGCLKMIKSEKAHRNRLSQAEKKIHQREINTRIANFQSRLKVLKSTPSYLHTPTHNKEMQDIAAQLRSLFVSKGHATKDLEKNS